jgi:hypothetical protein
MREGEPAALGPWQLKSGSASGTSLGPVSAAIALDRDRITHIDPNSCSIERASGAKFHHHTPYHC